MTNYRAVAAVTAALRERIGDALAGVISLAGTTNLRPANSVNETSPPTVNVFLYRAVPNASLRNAADPVRDASGQVIRQVVAAWDLHYLLTFVGDEAQLEPDLLMGATVVALTAGAALEKGFMAAVDTTLRAQEGNRVLAAGSGLDAEQARLVKLTPTEMSVETMAQLWGSLTSESYALSLAYEASVVVMSAELSPAPPLPVGGPPAMAVAPASAPSITAAHDSAGEGHPIVIGSRLFIEGRGLAGPNVQVRIGALDIDVANADVTASRIEVWLSPESGGVLLPRALAPGILGVRVRHLVDVGDDPLAPELRPGPTSNTLAITLRPEIVEAQTLDMDADDDDDPAIALVLAPAASDDWDYALLLNEYGVTPPIKPRALLLSDWSVQPASEDPPEPARVLFKSAAVPSGEWLVRVRVNGADSLLRPDASGAYAQPRVSL